MKSVGLLRKPLKNIKTRKRAMVIAVASNEPSAGATHFVLMLGHYLAKLREKVTLVECNDSEAYSMIEKAYRGYEHQEDHRYEETNRFKAKGVTYIKNVDEDMLTEIYLDKTDIVILDIGYSINEYRDEMVRADKLFVIGHYSDWKREGYKAFIDANEDLFNSRSSLLINLDDGEGRSELKRMTGMTCYSIPCIHDPFVRSKERDQLMKRIVGEL